MEAIPKEQITASDLVAVQEAADKYGLRLSFPVKTYWDDYQKYGFRHPDHNMWIFTIDAGWRKWRMICFHKRFAQKLQENRIFTKPETGGGENYFVEEKDLDRALQVCAAALTERLLK